ncbi:MAG TPA: pitrilysin family protein [Candidatus Syntrophosphaera sp.]|nr:pitrilysin family protein [Candidatus Syntrophosphaera sp.]
MTPLQLPDPVSHRILANGFKYIVQPDHAHPVLSLQLYIKTGSCWENPLESGYSHFVEHLVFKSTRNFGYNQLMQFVNTLGGTLNAYTDFDCTCYYLSLPSEFCADALQALSELVIHPTFGSSDVALEKDIILEELNELRNDPESDWLEFVQASCFLANPLRQPVLGTPVSVRSASLSKLRAFFAQRYQPQNAFLVVAGDIAQSALQPLVLDHFGSWNNTGTIPKLDFSVWLEPELPQRRQIQRRRETCFLCYALPELTDSHPASDALLIALRYLAQGRSSRLFQRLVEEEKLCSNVRLYSYSGILSGMSVILLSPTHSRHLDRCSAIFEQEYRQLLAGALPAEECELVKQDIVNTWRYGFESMESLAGMLGAEEFIGRYQQLYHYDQTVARITLQQVLDAVRRYWQEPYLVTLRQSPNTKALPAPKRNAKQVTPKDQTPPGPAPQLRFPTTSLASVDMTELAPGYYQCSLPSGLRLLHRHTPGRPITGFALAVPVSQLNEHPDQRGVNYLCSGTMLHSSQNLKHAEVLRYSRERGLSLNVEQHLDTTVFAGKCFHDELPAALQLLAELLMRPVFEPGWLKTVQLSTLDHLRRDRRNPAIAAYLGWLQMVFGTDSPYVRNTGRASELSRRTREQVVAWHAQHYQPQAFTLAVIGAADPSSVQEWAHSLFAPNAATALTTGNEPPLPHSSLRRRKTLKLDSRQSIVYLGGFAPASEAHMQTTAFYVLAQILGGDMDSRLFTVIREKYGYAYQTGFDYVSLRQTGFWNAYAYCDRDDLNACLRLLREILASVCEHGVSAEELLQAQNYLCGQTRFEQENSSLHAMLLASLGAVGYDPLFYYRREERIRACDRELLRQLAQSWLSPSNQWICVCP